MGLVYQPWFIPITIIFFIILRSYLEKKEELHYQEDAKKYIKVEGSEEVVPPWRKQGEKKAEKPKRGFGFWLLNIILILYVLFVWVLTRYHGFSKEVYEIIAGFTIALYFFYLDIPGYISNIWTYREYPGSVKGEITLSKHFIYSSKKNEAKIFLIISFFYYLMTLSNIILGAIFALIIRVWFIDRRLSKISLPDW